MTEPSVLSWPEVAEPVAEKRRVLVVDDDEALLDVLRRALSRFAPSLEFLTARSAEAALPMMGNGRISLVVSDFRLPGASGLELLTTIGREHPGVRRILLTGDPERDLASTAMGELGVDRLFIKPVDVKSLARVCEHLAHLAQAEWMGEGAHALATAPEEGKRPEFPAGWTQEPAKSERVTSR